MHIITRLTTTFNVTEDRLQLSAELNVGEPVTLWLTQRLANPLFKTLAKGLENGADFDRLSRDTHLGWEQAAARSWQPALPPVVVPTSTNSRLLNSIDLQRNEQQCRLILKAPPDFSAALDFSSTQLHQWLAIARRLYNDAAWPSELWPHWLSPQPSATQPQPGQTVH